MQLPENVVAILEHGGQVVTANARAAHDLRRVYGEARLRDSGRRAWESPAVLDWTAWLSAEWQRLLLSGSDPRLLLTSLQEAAVWQAIVRPVVETRSLVSPDEVARLAQGAYARLAQYGGTAMLRRSDWESHAGVQETTVAEWRETELFHRWARQFERECERRGWLSAAQLAWTLADAYRESKITPPHEIVWTGFDHVTPAENAVQLALHDTGCVQRTLDWGVKAQTRRFAAQTVDEEVETCAAWVRDYLAAHPGGRVGVLVEGVPAMRAQLDRVFRRILTPGSVGLRATQEKPIYEFTLGLPLSDVPVVRAALLLLRWLTQPIEQEQISWLLTTGFIGDTDDAASLAAADMRLRRAELLPPEQDLNAFLQRLNQVIKKPAVARWMRSVKNAKLSLTPQLEKSRTCHQWVATVEAVLAKAGWPGTRAMDGVGQQVLERWRRVLEEVASLDFADTKCSYERFLQQLRRHAGECIFTAASEEAPVSISGVLESAGRAFDAVWMLGVTDEAWPAKSFAHPMLPLWLQKDLRMPRGDAGEDWGFGAAAIDRLRKSSTDLVFSYAREGATGSQRISALITDLPQEPSPCHISDARFGGLRTEEFEDDAAIAWPGGVAGGQEVLQRQAACPFKAFADKRLGGRDVRDSEHGLNAAQRGSLFHTAMQTLWRDPRLGNSAGLHVAIATGELAKCIQDHVGLSLEKYRSEAGRWENEYLDLEEQRLCYLVMEWMMYESGRSPFDVEKVETETEIDVDGLRLNVRMDRVDKLEGDRVLIDYKTGLVKPTQWFGDRPEQPQLPLYAVRGKVKALQDIYFASLRPGEKPRFIGAVTGDASRLFPPKASVSDQGREDTAAPDREVFQNMLDGWRKTLAGLSRDFQSGVAAVDPKHYPKTCKFCAFDGLCRVAEMDRAVVDASAVSREDFE